MILKCLISFFLHEKAVNNINSLQRKRRRPTVREIEVFIDTEEIAEFFFHELTRRGYVPAEEEIEELADIMFEYLLKKCIIDEDINEE